MKESVLVTVALVVASCFAQEEESACYSRTGQAIRCTPPFVNAAYNLRDVEATNTCNSSRYCRQTGVLGATKSCDECDAASSRKSHPPKFMVDLDGPDNTTWWQSITLYEYQEKTFNTNDMLKANIILHLGKSFDLTYIRIKFYSPRPESFAIYKRTRSEDPQWTPYQYYSASCEETYGKRVNELILPSEESKALCSEEYSDISPLTGGNVAFSTLEGRPGAYSFETSSILQEFVTATEIKVELTRLNTFGDEVFGDTQVLQSYFYAISDISIGGRCKCNGHANKCVSSTGQDLKDRLVCQCVHNTTGEDCDQCEDFYNDRPWAAGTSSSANECIACNCSGMSTRCKFDRELYLKTGHGGRCSDCRDNTTGINCELCKDEYYRQTPQERCRACNCNPTGSTSQKCSSSGQCQCKPGVTGDKCDRCQSNYYDFGSAGCRECRCLDAGSQDNRPACSSATGVCSCKEHVEGQNCDVCKPGYFNMQLGDPFGCTACFCSGHTSKCTSVTGFYKHTLSSIFDKGPESWTAIDRDSKAVAIQYNAVVEDIGVSAKDVQHVYFLAPGRFLGDQHNSYGQLLHFRLRIGRQDPPMSRADLVLEGSGRSVSLPMFAQDNPTPGVQSQSYSFRLHEHPSYGWMPGLSSLDFQKLLANLTAIKIRATYSPQGVGFLDDFKLDTAQFRGVGSSDAVAPWVEHCTCPKGYVGQYCESCAHGYRREPPRGGSFGRCVPCDCNNHSEVCEPETGRCICQHNTVGNNCERCAEGFYGYAQAGTPDDCKACPCPGQGPCLEQLDMTVSCLNCPEGSAGDRCDQCADGFFGDPFGRLSAGNAVKECARCDCNTNIDANAVGNCDIRSGECVKCIYNTTGFHCEKCLPGFYGDPLTLPKGDCKACQCYTVGSLADDAICDQSNGQCNCLSHVVGRQCDACEDGFWNVASGTGCEECACDLVGSISSSCDIATGQCQCKPGVEGARCNRCAANYYGFSSLGCTSCDCNILGSASLQCDESGMCTCTDSERITGAKCDACRENKFNLTAGCTDCPACYNLVQDSVNDIRARVAQLDSMLSNLGQSVSVNDQDFKKDLDAVLELTSDLTEQAKKLQEGNSLATGELSSITKKLDSYSAAMVTISEKVATAQQKYDQMDVSTLNEHIDSMQNTLTTADNKLQSEAQAILGNIRRALADHGQKSDNMTAMSDKANEIVRKQANTTEAIVATAHSALSTARDAQALAHKVMTSPADLRDKLAALRQSFGEAERSLEAVKNQAESALARAHQMYKESLSVYLEATMLTVEVPDIDGFAKQIAAVRDEAQAVKAKASEMLATHQALISASQKALQDAATLFNDTYNEQKVTDRLLAAVDQALEIASKATTAADETLKTAQNILTTLKGFDDRVRSSKDKAMAALQTIGDIEDNLNNAESKTKNASSAVTGATKDAADALSKATEAESVAKLASETAATIRAEASSTKDEASSLQAAFQQLQSDVAHTSDDVNSASTAADTNSKQIHQALTKADEAKNQATRTIEVLDKSLVDVLSISDALGRMPELNVTELERLEQLLNSTQVELESANIDSKFRELETFRLQQVGLMNDYTSQLEQLRADVDNIEVIVMAIPTTCYRPPVLEKSDTRARLRHRHRKH